MISTSYGPGRYDENYEQKGLDYPYAYVRWTENRNMTEYLRLLATGTVDIASMIEGAYPIADVADAFEILKQPNRPLLVLLDYGGPVDDTVTFDYKPGIFEVRKVNAVNAEKRIKVGIIGAGNFATGMHLPNLRKLSDKYEIRAICSRTGHKAKAIAEQFGAAYATTDYKEILSDPEIDLTMICTRHNLHGKLVLESLQAVKHTFVEKPLCLTKAELEAIKEFFNSKLKIQNSELPLLMVGFNRRFSKYASEVKKQVQNRINPLFIHYRMNAGFIPLDHWVHTEEGGGRIIGEACHIIDLFSFIIGSCLTTFGAAILMPKTNSISGSENKSIVLEYEDGSVATLEYFAAGSKELPKERIEVHFNEKSIIVDDYKLIKGYGVKVADISSQTPDKGQLEELEELYKCINGERDGWPIALESMIETTGITLELA